MLWQVCTICIVSLPYIYVDQEMVGRSGWVGHIFSRWPRYKRFPRLLSNKRTPQCAFIYFQEKSCPVRLLALYWTVLWIPCVLKIPYPSSTINNDSNIEFLYIYLGDLLCVESPDPKRLRLPSPLDLRRKILIKAKRQMTSEDTGTGSLTNAAAMESAAATVAMNSDPQLHQLNEASSQLLLEKQVSVSW